MVSYFFGGDTNLTPEDIKRQRMIANALAESRTPQNAGEGVGALMKGIAGALVNARANSAERAGRKSAMDAFNPILAALSSQSTPDVTTATPDFSTDAAAVKTDAAKPKSVMDMSLPPVKGTMENARTADRNSVQNYAGMDLKSGIKSAADALGIKPEDLATAISYETAGTFDPLKKGPHTKWGQHRGLIQFGEPQAKENGVDWNDPINSQLGPEGAVVKYLRSAGVKPGMELIDIYSAINAGGVNRPNASDANNGGAWGTVADKVKYQMDGHRKKALALMADPDAPATAFDAQPNLNKPVEVASLDARVPVVDVPEGFQKPDTLQTTDTPPVEVAQATTPKRARNEPSDEIVIKALMNPWLDDSQRAVAEMYYKQRISEREFQRKLEAERNDPKYKMDLERGQIELDNLRNPKKARNLTAEEERALGLPEDGVYQEKPDGSILTVREGSKPKSRRLTTEEVTTFGLDPTGVYEIDGADKISTIQQPKDPNSDLNRTKLKLEVLDKVKGEKFRTLTKDEKAVMGLPPDGAFQIDENTKKVFPISSGNTNIRVDTGTIPAGYKAVRDDQGNILSIEPLPGSKAAQEAAQAEEKAKLADQQISLKGDIVSQDIDRALSALDAKGLPSTGLGSMLSSLPGTNAKALSGLLDTIKANVSFDTLNQMRQASPTGGALGSVTENELKMLQSTLGSLEQSQDDNILKDNLNRVWNVYQDIVHGPGKGPKRRTLSFERKEELPSAADAPEGIDPDVWQYMTEEDKALWRN